MYLHTYIYLHMYPRTYLLVDCSVQQADLIHIFILEYFYLCINIHACLCTYTRIYMYVYVNINIHVSTYVSIFTYVSKNIPQHG
jgi:hypothetical protein